MYTYLWKSIEVVLTFLNINAIKIHFSVHINVY